MRQERGGAPSTAGADKAPIRTAPERRKRRAGPTVLLGGSTLLSCSYQTNKLVVTVTRLVSLSSFRARFSTTITTTAILVMSTVRKTRSGSQNRVSETVFRYF
jgi:hypothetical protein